jgi:hypothetical protein
MFVLNKKFISIKHPEAWKITFFIFEGLFWKRKEVRSAAFPCWGATFP